MSAAYFLITCEHGGNRVPEPYRPLFRGMDRLLRSHRGYDPGALTIARELAGALRAPLFVSTTTRLLIDLNRSVGHPRLYSEATRKTPAEVRRRILERYYLPYRTEAQESGAAGRRVVHIASHSLAPELDGEIRDADVGLLYDPGRTGEVELCNRWRDLLRARAPQFKVRAATTPTPAAATASLPICGSASGRTSTPASNSNSIRGICSWATGIGAWFAAR